MADARAIGSQAATDAIVLAAIDRQKRIVKNNVLKKLKLDPLQVEPRENCDTIIYLKACKYTSLTICLRDWLRTTWVTSAQRLSTRAVNRAMPLCD